MLPATALCKVTALTPNGLEIAKHPVGEPPGQRLETVLDPFCRSWTGRLHRVVRRLDVNRSASAVPLWSR
jgi:hypothetical protein